MKIVFNGTPSELASYDFHKTNKKRGENILEEVKLGILEPLQTKTARTVIKLKREIEIQERKFIVPHMLCAPTVTGPKNDKTIARKLKQIKIGTYLLRKYWKMLKT